MNSGTARLLERAGKPVLVVDDNGVVQWANSRARKALPGLAAEGTSVPDFRAGEALNIAEGRLECEAVEGGWALFLEADDTFCPPGDILDLIPIPIFWKDRAGIYRGCNLAFGDFLGMRPVDVVGKGVFELSPPELAEKYFAMDEALMNSGTEAVQRYQWEIRRTDGITRHVLFHKANLDDGSGRVIGLVGMVQDITELHRLERKFGTVFNACPDVVAITDKATGRYLDINPAFETALGYARAEVLGRTSLELGIWFDADERARMLAALGEQGRLANFETRFRRRDGSIFTSLVSAETTMLDGAECLIMVGHDISDRKREEVLLRQTADELLRSNAELERFAYVAAHDLQEPCRTICSFAQLLERRHGDSLGVEGREYLDYLAAGAQRMRDLIQGLLLYSRANSSTLHFETVNLDQLLGSTLADLAHAVEQSRARITIDALPLVRGDAGQLRLVFANLIANALKFQPPGQTPDVQVSARHDGDEWIVTVHDNGIGIPPEYAAEVFGMFRRLHRRDAYPGTGIGLAVVKRVVEAHGGRVWVESVPGGGATFSLTLPGTENADAPHGA
jgi:PAS domain S-box-containing protein